MATMNFLGALCFSEWMKFCICQIDMLTSILCLQNHAGHHEVGTGHAALSEDGIKKMTGLYTSPWWDAEPGR